MRDPYLSAALAVIAAATALLRFVPFWLFGGGRKTPKKVEKLSRSLPSAVMAMLVVYCFKDVRVDEAASVLPALIAAAAVTGLQLWRRSTLLSIVGGTLVYMFLVQQVF